MKNILKEEKGITLVALVTTIIILLILSGITIGALTSKKGLINEANQSMETAQKESIIEKIEADLYSEKTIIGRLPDEAKLIEIVEKYGTVDKQNRILTTAEGEYEISFLEIEGWDKITEEIANNSTKIEDSYVGAFADIDSDGTVDGVIFADLLTRSIKETQKWTNDNGVYELPTNVTVNNVNTYYISNPSYTDKYFGTHEVLSPKTTSGKKRFYIMMLRDFTTPAYTTYYWYKNAYDKMKPLITSNDFGEGKENTRKMIEKWNAAGTNDGYTDADQDNQDIWKHIQTKYEEGWFIPSKAEWAAFGNELGITKENHYSTYKLSSSYWSSSQYTIRMSFNALINNAYMHYRAVNDTRSVRLAATL